MAGRCAPRPERVRDENFNMEVEFYLGEAVFSLPVKVAANAAAGTHALTVNASYQACDNRVCLPPRTVRVMVPVEVRK